MALPKERSRRYVTTIYAIFIILFAFTAVLFYTSRCQKSPPRVAKQDDDNLKPKPSAEIGQKTTDKTGITAEPSGRKIGSRKSYNLADDQKFNTLGPQEDDSNDEKKLDDRFKTSSDEAVSPKAQPTPTKPPQISLGQIVSIFFSTDSTGLTNDALEKLEAIAELLLKHPDAEIIIEGYGDSNIDDRNNQRLSQLRADIVKNYLVRRGIGDEKIKAFWVGSINPAASDDSQEDLNKTHQVEVKFKRKSNDDLNN
jgi:outer membrane protein OmpA-like peptidoglycan-associated protein